MEHMVSDQINMTCTQSRATSRHLKLRQSQDETHAQTHITALCCTICCTTILQTTTVSAAPTLIIDPLC